MEQPQPATDVLRGAARQTLSRRGVRLRSASYLHPDSEAPKLLRAEEGVADVAARRAEVQTTIGPALPELMARLAQGVHTRYPWLLHDDELAEIEAGSGDGVTSRAVYCGGSVFIALPGTPAFAGRRGDPASHQRLPTDPLWILEALACADEAYLLGDDAGRRRLGFHVDLDRYRREVSYDRGLPAVDGAPHVVGEAWLDDEGLVRRARWEELRTRRRRTWPRPAPPVAPARLVSTEVELWEFGVAVSIPTPELAPPRRLRATVGPLGHLAAGAWRRRREYERERAGSGHTGTVAGAQG